MSRVLRTAGTIFDGFGFSDGGAGGERQLDGPIKLGVEFDVALIAMSLVFELIQRGRPDFGSPAARADQVPGEIKYAGFCRL